MATRGTTEQDSSEPARIAEQLRGADRARLVGPKSGDGLAALAIAGAALGSIDVPRHLSLASRFDDGASESAGPDPTIRFDAAEGSAALRAYEIAAALDADPDPALALAGAVAGGVAPHGPAFEAAREEGLEERPGVAVPTSDPATGIAYSGLFHADFSGNESDAAAFLETIEYPTAPAERDETRLASALALSVSEGPAPERAVDAIEASLAPWTSPTAFETIGGYGDVLEAAAAIDPGGGLASLLGTPDYEALLDLWAERGNLLHAAVDAVQSDNSTVATGTVEAIPPGSVARLARDFQVDAERVLIAGEETIALASTAEDAVDVLEAACPDEPVIGESHLGTVRTDCDLEDVRTEVERA
ncbi:MAG: hypothetical protein ACOCY6_03870 [Halodesulfurarchaeum sp.]